MPENPPATVFDVLLPARAFSEKTIGHAGGSATCVS